MLRDQLLNSLVELAHVTREGRELLLLQIGRDHDLGERSVSFLGLA